MLQTEQFRIVRGLQGKKEPQGQQRSEGYKRSKGYKEYKGSNGSNKVQWVQVESEWSNGSKGLVSPMDPMGLRVSRGSMGPHVPSAFEVHKTHES